LAKFSLAKALLAYSYASQRKNEKALEVARAVAATNSADEGTINALGCTFKICKADNDLASLYENVLSSPSGLFPEHFHVELFGAYCRLRDFKKMQQQAQRMHRIFQNTSNSKYLYWAVTSMLLQSDLSPTMLTVAEKMLSKVYHEIDRNRNPGAEEMELYLSTLIFQKKFDTAVSEFQSIASRPASTVLLEDEHHFRENTNKVSKQSEELTNIMLDLNLHTGNIDQLISTAREILLKFPDQWNVWELLIDKIVFHRADTSRKESYSGLQCFEKLTSSLSVQLPTTPAADPAAEEAADFAKLLAFNEFILTSQASNPKIRGPALAEVRMISSLFALMYRHSEKSRHLQRVFQEIIGADRLQLATNEVTQAEFWNAATAASNLSTEDTQVAVWLIWLLKKYMTQFQTKYVCFVDLKHTFYHLHQLKSASMAVTQVVFSYLFAFSGQEAQNRLSLLGEEVRQARQSEAATAAAAPAVPEAGIRTPVAAAPVSAESFADEDGDDDDSDDDDGVAADPESKSDATQKKKKSNRKKKNKNKKKSKKASAVVDLTHENKAKEEPKLKEVDAAALNAVVAKDEAILGRLCILGNILECHVYLFFQLSVLTKAVPELSSTSYQLVVHPHETISFFDEVSLLFIDGIGGELRTVRPGDTVLTTVLAQCRQSFLLLSKETNLDKYVHLLQWTGLLQHGLKRSPYSYVFKVDLLENYRLLGNGQDALTLFSDSLGVKYIQNDSLSYLIIPTLLETGLFKEAAAKFRAIVAFHRSCRRETLEMMGKAFEHGNYCKVLEMDVFVEQSRRSLALSVAHVEGRIMDMTTNIMSVMDLEQFYDMIMEESHDDTYRAFEDIDTSKVHNHQDFHLALDRLENCPVASAPYQCDLLRKDAALKHRIVVPTVLMQFTYHLLADESDKLIPLKPEDISHMPSGGNAIMFPAPVERFPQGIATPTSAVPRSYELVQTELLQSLANLTLYVLQTVKPAAAFTQASNLAKSDAAATVGSNPLALPLSIKEEFARHMRTLQLSMNDFVEYVLGASFRDKSNVDDNELLHDDVTHGCLFAFADGQYAVSADYVRNIWSCVRHSLTWVSFFWQIIVSKAYYTSSSESGKMKRPVSVDVRMLMQSVQREIESIMSAPDHRSLVDVFDNLKQEQDRLLSTLQDSPVTDKDDQSEIARILLSAMKEWFTAIVGLTRKLRRLQNAALTNAAIDRFAQFVSKDASFLPLPTSTNENHIREESCAATANVQAMCRESVEKTVRSTLSFHRESIERANTILQQRLNGLRGILSL
jgi:dsDNA-binding SOS-regulon protein